MYKVDTLLKCASIPVAKIDTDHQNTITGMAYFKMTDGANYICTTSIDKTFAYIKV